MLQQNHVGDLWKESNKKHKSLNDDFETLLNKKKDDVREKLTKIYEAKAKEKKEKLAAEAEAAKKRIAEKKEKESKQKEVSIKCKAIQTEINDIINKIDENIDIANPISAGKKLETINESLEEKKKQLEVQNAIIEDYDCVKIDDIETKIKRRRKTKKNRRCKKRRRAC